MAKEEKREEGREKYRVAIRKGGFCLLREDYYLDVCKAGMLPGKEREGSGGKLASFYVIVR